MGNKLYVGNLPFDTTEDQLHEMFSPFGQVTRANLIIDRNSGRSKGFGFVEMSSDSEAQAATAQLNGTEVGTRKIIVNEARPMEPRSGGGGAGGGRGGGGGGPRGYR
jgi:RNA recognition motif-containing protein